MEFDSAEIQNLDIRNPDDPSAPVAVNANPDQEGGKSLAELLEIPPDNWRGPEPVEEVPQTSIEYPDYQPLPEPEPQPEGEIGPRVADLLQEEPTKAPGFDHAALINQYGGITAMDAIAERHGITADELLRDPDFYFDVAQRGIVDADSLDRYLAGKSMEREQRDKVERVAAIAENWEQISERPEIVAANEAREAKQMLAQFIQSHVEERQIQAQAEEHNAAWGALVAERTSAGQKVPDPGKFFNTMVGLGYLDRLPPDQAVRATMDRIVATVPEFRDGGREAGSYSKTFTYNSHGRVIAITTSPGAPEHKPVAPALIPSGGMTAGQRSKLDELLEN